MKKHTIGMYVDENYKMYSCWVYLYDVDQAWGNMEISKGNGDIREEFPRCLYITNIATLPMYRRRGHARHVMEILEQLARRARLVALVLRAETSAVDFYLKLGFHIAHTQLELATKPELQNHILMRKDL